MRSFCFFMRSLALYQLSVGSVIIIPKYFSADELEEKIVFKLNNSLRWTSLLRRIVVKFSIICFHLDLLSLVPPNLLFTFYLL